MNRLIKALAARPAVSIFLRKIVEVNFRAQKKLIKQHFPIGLNERVLDIGCGTGEFSFCFPKSQYVGIDIDPKNIAYAQQHGSGEFLTADGRRLPFANASFDKVLVVGVFHHLSVEDCRLVFKEMKRVLKKGSKILIMEDTHSERSLVRFLQATDQGAYIRDFSEWNSMLADYFSIEKSGTFNNGACFYSYFFMNLFRE